MRAYILFTGIVLACVFVRLRFSKQIQRLRPRVLWGWDKAGLYFKPKGDGIVSIVKGDADMVKTMWMALTAVMMVQGMVDIQQAKDMIDSLDGEIDVIDESGDTDEPTR